MVPTYPQSNFALLAARILMAAIFVLGGIGKIGDVAGTAGYISSIGLPGGLLVYPAIIAELGGGLLILIGFQTRLIALLMAIFTIVLALLFHRNFGDMNQMINFLKNLGIAGGFLALMVAGAGDWSVDGARGQE